MRVRIPSNNIRCLRRYGGGDGAKSAEAAGPESFASEAELHEDELLAFAENIAPRGSHLGEFLHQVGLRGRRHLRGSERLRRGRRHDGGAGAAGGRRSGGGALRQWRAHAGAARSARARRARARGLRRRRARVTSARAPDRARRLTDHRASRPRLSRHITYYSELSVSIHILYALTCQK